MNIIGERENICIGGERGQMLVVGGANIGGRRVQVSASKYWWWEEQILVECASKYQWWTRGNIGNGRGKISVAGVRKYW